jgi:hypothetical protein
MSKKPDDLEAKFIEIEQRVQGRVQISGTTDSDAIRATALLGRAIRSLDRTSSRLAKANIVLGNL